jgi:hypothetical protein
MISSPKSRATNTPRPRHGGSSWEEVKGQQRLKLKPPRRRPTLAYVLELERRVLELQLALERMRARAAA